MRNALVLSLVGAISAIAAAGPLVYSYQEGADNGFGVYSGNTDATLRSGANTGVNFGNEDFLSVDGDDGSPGLQPNHVLTRFDNVFGNGAGQIPFGSTIVSATLSVLVTSEGSGFTTYQLLADWNESMVTWNNYGTPNNGVEVGVDSLATVVSTYGANNSSANVPSGPLNIDLTLAFQNFAAGQTNYGVGFIPFPNGTNGIDWPSSEASANRPKLTIAWTPEPASLAMLLAGLLIRRR